MKYFKLNQTGSHLIAGVVAVCVLGAIVFAGMKVIGGHSKVAVDSKTEAQTAAAPPAPSVPSGWKLFADKSIGVQFVYPATAGVFTKPNQNLSEFDSSLQSGNVAADYLPGVSGSFTLGSYKSASSEVTSRRYGPKIKLGAGEWIVTEPNQYDSEPYQKGDVYTEMTHSNTHGLDVYTATSGDEGVIQYNLYFVTLGKLRELQLPPFDSGVYSSSYNVNDQAPYDTMYSEVRDSISLY